MMRYRQPRTYGDVHLSVQASSMHYCSPRQDGLRLRHYSLVEVALFTLDGRETGSKIYHKPSDLGLDRRLDHYFNEEGIGSWVPKGVVKQIRRELRRRNHHD